MRARLDHIGIAVANLDDALAFYRDALGLEIDPPEDVQSQRVRAHFIPLGDAALELLEATADDSPIAKFLMRRLPLRLIDDQPRPGAHGSLVAFIHPSSAQGVLVELTQRAAKQTKISGFKPRGAE